MKIVGIVLILGALVFGSLTLADIVPGYFHNKEALASCTTRAEAAAAKAKAVTTDPNASEAAVAMAMRDLDTEVEMQGYSAEGVVRRRNEMFLYGGSAFGLLVLGVVLFMVGWKRSARRVAPRLVAI